MYAIITILGSTFYCIGGLLTLKLKNKKMKMSQLPLLCGLLYSYFHCLFFLNNPGLKIPLLFSTLSLLYLGVVATGFAWLIRFRINSQWLSFSNTSSVLNSNIWNNFRIFSYE